ncbi:response regulator [Pseudoalteromonas piscicida]|uniref:histidine kinase n=1 Tax=Pseudoalteromonas piscicida TaxID=43662 RepID=A0AAD0RJQ2_PSEO7|nr:response regulator [Pseudoalteromonas piscicida]ASD66368.1 hybrid sensor histidine kinase/response regulator [Pseudoalteromonas piscicida]AXQ97286.1 response regulator [Pseudoalteromonas piscicida]AXR02924.1 response regulator [Pseudoalteromonas piscicida]
MRKESVSEVNVLLIEDDEDDYILTLDYLQSIPNFKFNLVWQSQYHQALEALESNGFDLCLLDYQLGPQTGLSVLKEARARQVHTPIIMLTGQSDEVLDNEALKAGAEDFVLKSEISSARFIRSIRYALARKELERERLERLRVESDSRAKDRFLAHLSHELRTPLTSILGYTNLLLSREELQNVKPELSIINNNSEHLLNLLNDVLDLSKLNENRLQLNKQSTCLNSFLSDLFSLFKMAAAKKGLSFSIEAKTPLPQDVKVDKTRLKQVLINIIYNAIKFTSSGFVKVEITLQADAKLEFKVIDTGIGIPCEKLKRIFKPFEQVQNVTTRTDEGAGLGLAISSALIKLMGGELAVESTLGEGSEFGFSIDLDTIDEMTLAPLMLDKTQSATDNSFPSDLKGHILIVEDISEIQMLLRTLIGQTGSTAEIAGDGIEALAMLKDDPDKYDLILMDLHMPRMDGRDTIVALRERGIDLPVVALTAAAQKGTKEELMALGFSDMMSKPVNVSEFGECLELYLSDGLVTSRDDAEQAIGALQFLVVEDDADTRNLLKLLLNSLQVNVVTADSAQSCWQHFVGSERFDTILLDIGLPDKSGLTLAREIKAQDPSQHIVIASGFDPEPEKLAESQVDEVLLKPITLVDLKEVKEKLV